MRYLPFIISAILSGIPLFAQDAAPADALPAKTEASSDQAIVIDDDIMFYLNPVDGKGIDSEMARTLDSKIRQGIARSKAASENPDELFEIKPEFFISESGETDGMVLNVAKVKGELVLNLVSRIDGGVFNTVKFPLTGTAAGGKDAALKAMVASLKPSSPAFVRFVRTSRDRVKEYYAAHPEKLRNPVKPRESKPAQTPLPATQTAPVAATPAPAAQPAPVAAAPAPESTPEPVKTPENSLGELFLSAPEKMNFKIVSCTGSKVGRSITLTARLTNLDPDISNYYVVFLSAILGNGKEKGNGDLGVNDQYSQTLTAPDKVPLTITFRIKGVDSSCDTVTFTKFHIGQYEAQVRNIPVTWQ